MRRILILAATAAMAVPYLTTSCSKSAMDTLPQEETKLYLSLDKLPYGTHDLTPEHASIVAKLFLKNSPPTKSDTRKEIESIVPILSKTGETLSYAINYIGGGFLIVSANTDYFPILADVKKGHYSANEMLPISPLLSDYEEDALISKQNSISYRHAWEPYIQHYLEGGKLLTKVEDEWWDQFYDLLYDEYYSDWVNDGWNVYFLHTHPYDMPDNLYNSFCNTARDNHEDYEGLGVNYKDVCVILEKYNDNNTIKGPFLSTHWGQGYPWNSSAPGSYLGCVTIATGQIMRFHQHPSYYNWSNMPNSTTSNSDLSDFLATLKTQLLVTNNGVSSIYLAKGVLEQYGYTCQLINPHTTTSTVSSLYNNLPVYMRGEDPVRSVAHAWVCDGYYSLYSDVTYKLFLLNTSYGQPDSFSEFDSELIPLVNFITLHMNWGYSGDYDGYYYDTNISFNDNGVIKNYSSNRKDLHISH